MPDQEPVTVPVSSHDIAWWAETADGTRDKPLRLVLNADGKCSLIPETKSLKAGEKVILNVRTASHQPNRERPVVTVVASGSSKELTDCDAVFWTESAVDKFVGPYYHSHRLFDDEIEQILEAYYQDENVVAIAHFPPSRLTKISSGTGTSSGESKQEFQIQEFRLAVRKKDMTKPGITDQFEVALMSLTDYLAQKNKKK